MAQHTWSHLGDTVSDTTNHMYYRGQRIKEAYYRGEKIWGDEIRVEEPIAEFTIYVVRDDPYSTLKISLTFRADWIKYSLNNGRKIEVIPNSSGVYTIQFYSRDFTRSDTNVDLKIFGANVTSFSVHDGSQSDYAYLYITEIVIPFASAFEPVTSCSWALRGLYKLSKIPDYLFANMPNVTNYTKCFEYADITEIPPHLFGDTNKATNIDEMFAHCTRLQIIPEHVFDLLTDVTTAKYLFYLCTTLERIPTSLFSGMTKLQTVQSCFMQCYKLSEIPETLFANNPNITSFDRTFYVCDAIEEIPSGLFANNINATIFTQTFGATRHVKSIPSGLFTNNINAINFSYCFAQCEGLETIPSGLFENVGNTIDFKYCFYECTSLQSIPYGLFPHSKTIKSVEECFARCSSLLSIPTELIPLGYDSSRYSPTSIRYCFAYCSSLETIPSGLFLMQNSYGGEASPTGLFTGCTSLKTIPSDLFKDFNRNLYCGNCFSDCTSLESIPSDLFSHCRYTDTSALILHCNEIFKNCTNLRAIPKNLFNPPSGYCRLEAKNAFENCEKITSISEQLFIALKPFYDTLTWSGSYSSEYSYIDYMFKGCSALSSIPTNLFDIFIKPDPFPYSPEYRYWHPIASYKEVFSGCTNVVGPVPELWNMYDISTRDGTGCFRGCEQAENYDDIPSNWK